MGRLFSKIADFFRESDKMFFFLCVAATFFGCMAVYSSTHYIGSSRPFIVQAGSMVLGLIAAVIISAVDFEWFCKRWYFMAIVGLVPVILTFFIGFAPEGTDDKAWLNLGITTFQPAELMKICFIITFAAHLAAVKSKNINKLKVLIPVCLHAGFCVALIHFQGDDGTALVFFIMALCMMWAAGVSFKYFLTLFGLVLVGSPIIYFVIMNDDQRSRIISVFNIESDIQGATYQQYRGRMALANGGFFGQGFLKGDLTQIGGVPEGQNDFIFVSIGEELGFIGCLLVLLLLGALCIRCLQIAKKCRKDNGKYIAIGFFGMMFAQILINVGMCIAIFPVIGVTLPFFSAGGTSLLCMYLGVGLVMSVYKHRNYRTIYLHD